MSSTTSTMCHLTSYYQYLCCLNIKFRIFAYWCWDNEVPFLSSISSSRGNSKNLLTNKIHYLPKWFIRVKNETLDSMMNYLTQNSQPAESQRTQGKHQLILENRTKLKRAESKATHRRLVVFLGVGRAINRSDFPKVSTVFSTAFDSALFSNCEPGKRRFD